MSDRRKRYINRLAELLNANKHLAESEMAVERSAYHASFVILDKYPAPIESIDKKSIEMNPEMAIMDYVAYCWNNLDMHKNYATSIIGCAKSVIDNQLMYRVTKIALYIKERLEEIREQLARNDEGVSTEEICELQSYIPFIDKDDVELLEWAGVSEFPDDPEKDEFEFQEGKEYLNSYIVRMTERANENVDIADHFLLEYENEKDWSEVGESLSIITGNTIVAQFKCTRTIASGFHVESLWQCKSVNQKQHPN